MYTSLLVNENQIDFPDLLKLSYESEKQKGVIEKIKINYMSSSQERYEFKRLDLDNLENYNLKFAFLLSF